MLLKSCGLVLAVLAFGVLALTSCTTTSPPPSETPTKETKPYGKLTVSTGSGFAGGIDPQDVTSGQIMAIGRTIFDALIDYGPKQEVIPMIAERWEIARDGMSQTFFIRKGVRFHDGSDLTAADVKFSIERMLNSPTPNNDVPAWRKALDRIEVKDDYTLVLQMKQPQFDFVIYTEAMTAVVPKKYIEEKGGDYFRKNPVGSGPWKFVSFIPGDHLDLEANENYWGAVPKFKNVSVKRILEEITKVAMLKTGELDVAGVSADSVADLKAAGIRVIKIEGDIGFFAWPFYDTKNPDRHAVGDVRVRKAMQLALNAKEMADNLFRGAGGAYVLPQVSRNAYFFDPNLIKPDPFDPEQAKKLLAEAGYPNGFATKILDTGGGSILSIVDLAIAGYWRKIGVSADIQPIDYSLIPPMLVPQISPDIWGKVWASGPGGPRQGFEGLSLCYHSKFGCAKNHTNARLDELIEKVPMTGDPAEKKRLATEAAVLARNEYVSLAVVAAYRNLAYNSSKVELDEAHLYPSGSDLVMLELPWVGHAK